MIRSYNHFDVGLVLGQFWRRHSVNADSADLLQAYAWEKLAGQKQEATISSIYHWC